MSTEPIDVSSLLMSCPTVPFPVLTLSVMAFKLSAVCWSFSEITPQSFRWRGEVSVDDGASWRLDVEFLAHRV